MEHKGRNFEESSYRSFPYSKSLLSSKKNKMVNATLSLYTGTAEMQRLLRKPL